jgi:hypothetical protein
MLVLGTAATNWATNPRGWLLDPTIDVATPAGVAQLKTRILQWADNRVQILLSAKAQGMITWDIEGEMFPHSTTRLRSTVLPQRRPRWRISPTPISNSATPACVGVVCGLSSSACSGVSASQQDVADLTQLLINKINYAKSRWGASIFYMDSNGGPGDPMDPSILQRVSAAIPGVLIIPEHSNLQYYAYTAPYRQINQGYTSAEADARLVYSKGFAILNVADAPIQEDYNQLVTSVTQGDILLFRAWFDDCSLTSVKSIYQAAGQPVPPVDTTPPSVSIVGPPAGSTISSVATVSRGRIDNTGIARGAVPVGWIHQGTAVAPPYTASLNPASFRRQPRSVRGRHGSLRQFRDRDDRDPDRQRLPHPPT